MNRRTTSRGLMVLLVAAFGCGDEPTGETETERWVASLSPDAVVNTDVVSNASGTASLEYDGTVLEYQIDVQAMDEVTAAHIHGPASPGQTGQIILFLFSPSQPTGPVSGTLVTGTAGAGSPGLRNGATFDRVIELMRADSAFVMVHSTTYPGGEIRGQIVPD